jgi:hypothetical protein
MRNFLERNVFTERFLWALVIFIVLLSSILGLRGLFLSKQKEKFIMIDRGHIYIYRPAQWVKESEVSE